MTTENKSTSFDVLESIQSELEYQNEQTANTDRPDMIPELSMGDYLLAMEENLHRARQAWYTDSPEADYQPTMEFVRKIAALAFKAGKQNGMPKRS